MAYLTIEKMGRIQSAKVELGDLTIFIGKNGTNKSYMSHVFFGVSKGIRRVIRDSVGRVENNIKEYLKGRKKLEDFKMDIKDGKIRVVGNDIEINVDYRKESDPTLFDELREYDQFFFDGSVIKLEGEVFLSEEIYKEIVKGVFNVLQENIKKEVNDSFNVDVEERKIVGELHLDLESFLSLEDSSGELVVDMEVEEDVLVSYDKESICGLLIYGGIFRKIKNWLLRHYFYGIPYYFPASRTGFILAFDDIVAGVLRDRFGGQPTATKLSYPTIDFISNMLDIKTGGFRRRLPPFSKRRMRNGVSDSIVKYIEENITKSEVVIKKEKDKYLKYYFRPLNTKEQVPLHLSSSSSVETLPLILILKEFGDLKGKFIIFEEPEAHLHPKAQIEMARVLVMLANAGAKVLITTHSDYIFNEIRSCINLSRIGDDEEKWKMLLEKGVKREFSIDPRKVKSYLFKEGDDHVDVNEIPMDSNDLEEDAFSEVLDEVIERYEFVGSIISKDK